MTINKWLKDSIAKLAEVEIETPRLDCLVLLGHVLKRDKGWILAHLDEKLSTSELSQLLTVVEKRTKRIPIAYILGYKEFYGLKLSVNKHVLIPRPETEALVEWASKQAKTGAEVLEIGTGSGAIALALKNQRSDVSITATDVLKDVVVVANANADALELNTNFVQSDMFASVNGTYDMIIANLPYLRDDGEYALELDHEPAQALFSGRDGLSHYKRFFDDLDRYLRPGGVVLIEHEPEQLNELNQLASKIRLKAHSVTKFVTQYST